MKIILAGSKTISVKCLEWLINEGENVHSVFVHKDKDANLDWQESLKEKAKEFGIITYDNNINKYTKELSDINPDILFSIQYGPLIKKNILDIPKLGCVNLHNGDLPRYGGCGPIYHAILNGENEIAVTLHYMDEQFDTGDIISKKHLKLKDETAGEVFEKITEAGFELFKQQFYLIKNENNKRLPQTGERLYYKKDDFDFNDPDQRIIKGNENTIELRNKIRAFTFPKRNWSPKYK